MLQDIRGSISEKGHILKVMERDFKGIWIPKEIWLNENLSPLDKIVLAEIDSLDSGKGCYASNEYLADFCKCSTASLTRSISTLKKEKLIVQKSFDGRERVLKSLVKMSRQPNQNEEAASSNCATYIMNNNIENNIVDNTIPSISPSSKKKKEKKAYGKYENVKLTDDEYKRLCDDYPNAVEAIMWFDEYIEEKGCQSKSHNLTMRRWVFDAIREQEQKRKKLAEKEKEFEKQDNRLDFNMEDIFEKPKESE